MSRLHIIIALLLVVAVARPLRSGAEWEHVGNNADIRAMFATDSLLWVGTNGGLFFVDRVTGAIQNRMLAGAVLPDNSIRVIEAIKDVIFVGTDAGFVAFDSTMSVVNMAEWHPPIPDLRAITGGPSGTRYFSTFGSGVGLLEPEDGFRWIRSPQDSLLDNKVYAVYETDSSDVYYATSLGLCAYIDSAWVGFQAGAGLPRGEVIDMVPTAHEDFYALIAGHGVYRFVTDRGQRIRSRNIFPDDEISAITVDPEGRLWAAGRYGGIARYAGTRWEAIGTDDPVVMSSRWRSAYAAPDGQVYFGSADGLILVAIDEVVRTISIPSDLPAGYIGPIVELGGGRTMFAAGAYVVTTDRNSGGYGSRAEFGSVFAIAESPTGDVWIATPWGLFRRGEDGFEAVQPDIEPLIPVFVSLSFDATGALWAGAHNGEVYRFDGEIWVQYASRYDLSGRPVRRVLVDGKRRVWALSGRDQVHRYEGTRWAVFGQAAFDSLAVKDMAVGPDGNPVVVTDSNVWRYGIDQTWQRLDVAIPAGSGALSAVHFDDLGRMFLGAHHGVLMVGGHDVRWVGTADGLGGREVTRVFVDSEDVLWVGFRRDGLSRISLEKLSP